MSNQCGGCTLCCTLERVPELNKPRYQACEFCEVGVGCRVHKTRPDVCRNWHCWWVKSELGENFRPDRIHLYAHQENDTTVRVMVDPKYFEAWKTGDGAEFLKLIAPGHYVFVAVGDQINFICGDGLHRPDQITLDWTL